MYNLTYDIFTGHKMNENVYGCGIPTLYRVNRKNQTILNVCNSCIWWYRKV